MSIVAGICKKHGFYKAESCPKCDSEPTQEGIRITTYDWVKKGEWEHIDPALPNMKIDSKEQLRIECEKRGLIPKAFMKPKSQGKGFEIGKRFF